MVISWKASSNRSVVGWGVRRVGLIPRTPSRTLLARPGQRVTNDAREDDHDAQGNGKAGG